MHMELGRKGGEPIRLGPRPLAGDTEEEGDITHRLKEPPWEARGLSHTSGTPAQGSDTGNTITLSWFENQWDLLEGCKKPRLCS